MPFTPPLNSSSSSDWGSQSIDLRDAVTDLGDDARAAEDGDVELLDALLDQAADLV